MFKVYVIVNDEIIVHSLNPRIEEKRIYFPSISTEGKILGMCKATGLKDRNGIDIFENYFQRDELGRISIVEFHHGSFWIKNIESPFYSERLHSDNQFKITGNSLCYPEFFNAK